ncbi:MAG: indolepyruvate ferredoxin oxidoreductase subunit alpha [Chloroflexota bacterium]
MKRLLSGNEAIALGAWEAGVRYASAYPGTPSTEILETISQRKDIVAEWSSNEKVALDNAIGASFAGVRAMASMKHVGVNVAADSLMSVSYTGVNGGLVLVSADDPGTWSSQNEQDNRHYARFGKFPCLDPADSQEAKDFTIFAFELSERFNTIVMLRTTTRISHSKSTVEVAMPDPPLTKHETIGKFIKRPDSYVIIPANARRLHPQVEQRMVELEQYAEDYPLNRVEWGDKGIGVITGGIAYQYAKEVFTGYSFLKLGMSHPIPKQLIRSFAEQVDQIVVIEELDPFWEHQIRSMGIDVVGKDYFPLTGELTLGKVRIAAQAAGLEIAGEQHLQPEPLEMDIPPRIPSLCPGCPHRAVFFSAAKQRLLVAGDIGCYTIGVLPPFNAMDTCISMGASIGVAHGIRQAGNDQKSIAVIGDSTFFHTGLPALANSIYNRVPVTTVILDNHTTGMTGGQGNPGSGIAAQTDKQAAQIDIEAMIRSMGVSAVWKVDSMDAKAVDDAIKQAVKYTEGPAVVVVDGDCVMNEGWSKSHPVVVDLDTCNGCTLCFKVGCPAILKSKELDEKSQRPKAEIDPLLCTGCEICLQVCPRDAIYHPEVGYG